MCFLIPGSGVIVHMVAWSRFIIAGQFWPWWVEDWLRFAIFLFGQLFTWQNQEWEFCLMTLIYDKVAADALESSLLKYSAKGRLNKIVFQLNSNLTRFFFKTNYTSRGPYRPIDEITFLKVQFSNFEKSKLLWVHLSIISQSLRWC